MYYIYTTLVIQAYLFYKKTEFWGDRILTKPKRSLDSQIVLLIRHLQCNDIFIIITMMTIMVKRRCTTTILYTYMKCNMRRRKYMQ